jgi:cell division protein FtsI (penicillin-binding protein 3)
MLMIFLTFGLSVGILGFRAVRLHTHSDEKLMNLAENQHTETLRPLPLRGNIYDRRGQELAVSAPTYSLAAHPGLIQNRGDLAKKLSRILNMKMRSVKNKLTTKKKFVWIKRRLMPDEVRSIQKLEAAGLTLQKEARRYYPNRELASQVLGAAGYDGEGLGGLELYYEHFLKGPRTREVAYRDARGAIYAVSDNPLETRGVAHLHLNLDRNIQYVAESELSTAAHRLNAKRGTIIVMDPKTGAIIAMASYPRFNPNTYQNYNMDHWRSVAVSDEFEPGSSFKAITVAAALENKLLTTRDSIDCENGLMKIGKTSIHDHEKYGLLTLPELLKVSSNIGTAKIAQTIGKDDLYKTIRRFGFGQRTGIDFPGEAEGQVRDPNKWHPVDHATISFGQGLTATALQITSAYATIANKGQRMKPQLVKQITGLDGERVKVIEAKSLGQVIRPEVAAALTEMLVGVTEEGGTGLRAAIKGYRIAGKTGTAQKYDIKNRTYSKTDYFSSFVGFGPAENPRLVVFVGIDSPQGIYYGGEVAAPIFRKVMSAALYQLKIPPSQQTLPLIEHTSANMTIKDSNKKTWQEPSPIIPDFSGLSIRQVLSLIKDREMSIDIEGTGIAYRQEPSPGRTVKQGHVCRVYFRQPT